MPIPRGAAAAISFDYGNVLGGLDLEELAERLAARGRPAARVDLDRAMTAAYAAHDEVVAAGKGHEAGWRALMATLVRAGWHGADSRDVDGAVEAIWRAQPDRNLWRLVPDEARELLSRLGSARVPMVITSNSEGRLAELLVEVGIADSFVAILDSGVLGFAKPDRRIFELAADKLGVPIGRIVHVGDSEGADVAGAVAAGAFAVRFDGFVPGSARRPTAAHERCDTHAQLRELLEVVLARTL